MENIYNNDMKDLVLSRQDFASFRKKNRLYVDKTEYAYRLAKEKEGFYFISRPRRFGKSLFCSMLEALFRSYLKVSISRRRLTMTLRSYRS